MPEKVTIDQAIAKGHRMVDYPAGLIFFCCVGIGGFLYKQDIMPGWAMLLAVACGIVFAWAYWCVMLAKWKLWAFEHVRNVHQLKKRAIRENLLPKSNSFTEKLIFTSRKQQAKWKLLQTKFEQEDLFEDDLSVPSETIIYYSKTKNYLQMLTALLFAGIGLYLFYAGEAYFFASIALGYGGLRVYFEYKEATNSEAQIIINEKGIETISTDFYEWNEIENEEAISVNKGKRTEDHLCYDHPGGSEYLNIDDYDIDLKRLNELLVLYRGRASRR